MEIIAKFFVGLPGGRWEQAGPYSGRGADLDAAADNALASCAVDYADQG